MLLVDDFHKNLTPKRDAAEPEVRRYVNLQLIPTHCSPSHSPSDRTLHCLRVMSAWSSYDKKPRAPIVRIPLEPLSDPQKIVLLKNICSKTHLRTTVAILNGHPRSLELLSEFGKLPFFSTLVHPSLPIDRQRRNSRHYQIQGFDLQA